MLSAGVSIVQKIRRLALAPDPGALPPPLDNPDFWQRFASDLGQDLFAEYLLISQPAMYVPLHLLGVVDETNVSISGAPGRLDYVRRVLRWDRLGTMVTDPGSLLGEVYGWGGTFRHDVNTEKLWSLNEMERTSGEPDVVGHDKKTGEYIFYDCSAESPKAGEVFATIVKRWTPEKNINQKITLLIWQLPWALRF